MDKYLKVYKILAVHNFSVLIGSRLDFWLLIAGKLIRMGLVLLMIASIFNFVPVLADYTRAETLLFFATFNIIDILAQAIFFRGFWFTQKWVREGEFDHFLKYPINPLFMNAFKITDWMDILTLIPAVAILIYTFSLFGSIHPWFLFLYCLLVLNGVLIAFAINVFIASLNFYTPETENAFLLYRDLMYTARFPTEIFGEPLRLLFTFALPIAVIVAFPAKAFLGILNWKWVWFAFALSSILVFSSIKFWKRSLKHYSSASS
jgi:ABC-2 type transport system permease protein